MLRIGKLLKVTPLPIESFNIKELLSNFRLGNHHTCPIYTNGYDSSN